MATSYSPDPGALSRLTEMPAIGDRVAIVVGPGAGQGWAGSVLHAQPLVCGDITVALDAGGTVTRHWHDFAAEPVRERR